MFIHFIDFLVDGAVIGDEGSLLILSALNRMHLLHCTVEYTRRTSYYVVVHTIRIHRQTALLKFNSQVTTSHLELQLSNDL